MVPIAHRVRTSLALAGATGTILVALLLHARERAVMVHPDDYADDGWRVEARLTSTKILSGTMDHDLAVTIQAPGMEHGPRPHVSLAIVIDRSGSMLDNDVAQPLANAKAAAVRLIDQLGSDDAFAVVTYSSYEMGAQPVFPIARATSDNKAAARARIATIEADGGTCISCGITGGAHEIAQSPITDGISRMVLISDGQATEGLRDRSELSQLVAETATRGISISTVGVGLDFDEVTMAQLASVGRGNYYFVEDTRELDAMFRQELDGLGATIARQMRLVLADQPGTRIEEVYGYPHERIGDTVVIPIADMRAGESRKVVLRVSAAPKATGAMTITTVGLHWNRVSDGKTRRATTAARAEVVEDVEAVAASIDVDTVQVIEQALTARALEEASTVYDTHGSDAAIQVMEVRGAAVRANRHLRRDIQERLERANAETLEILRTAPATKAKKVTRVHAYELAR